MKHWDQQKRHQFMQWVQKTHDQEREYSSQFSTSHR